jgi:AraC-like DNA-binding protein
MDALAAVVTLLRPQTVLSKTVHGAGRWGVRYPAVGHPSFAVVLKGPCWLAVEEAPATMHGGGGPPGTMLGTGGPLGTMLGTGDFVLFPATPGFTLASDPEVTPQPMHPVPFEEHVDDVTHGDPSSDPSSEPSVSLLGGYFAFEPLNASLLVDLLPSMLHIRATDPAIDGVAPIVELIRRETREPRAGQALVLTRLAEILLVEALRSAPADLQPVGLLAGLRDPQLAAALRAIHTRTAEPWTLATLAHEASMSRSSFAERFARVIGMPPLSYVLQWRIAVARSLLAREQMTVAETALAVGYQSASGFSTAFSRATGHSPKELIGSGRADA